MARELRARCAKSWVIQVVAIGMLFSPLGAPGHATDEEHLYEPATVETVVGRVERVETLPGVGGRGRDVTVVLSTTFGPVTVAIAPRWVLESVGLRLRRGDDIQVLGWRIVRVKPPLLAAEIRKDTQVFVFRDRYGTPVWGGRRRLRSGRPLPSSSTTEAS